MTSYQNSYEIWSALERTFSSQTKARTLQLKMQLQSSKKGALSIIDYYTKIKLLVDNLIATGNFIIDEELTLSILSGLGA